MTAVTDVGVGVVELLRTPKVAAREVALDGPGPQPIAAVVIRWSWW